MKYLFLFWTLVLTFNLSSQQTNTINGLVTYKVTPNDYLEKIESINTNLKNQFSPIYKTIEKFNLFLKFNQFESFFEIEEGLLNDANPSAYRFATMVTGGRYYTNLKQGTVIRQKQEAGEDLLIALNLKPTNSWSITKESKIIKGFKCFKATRTKTNVNSKGEHHFTIIAWFAPEIPAQFGPKEFNNLPGLILELYDTHHNFYAESVKFLKNPPKITPFKGDLITEEEYKTRIHSNLNNFKKSIKRD